MPDGSPDEFTKKLGEGIARLRTSRNISRTALVSRVIYQLPVNHPLTESIGENWFNRLEGGRMVKVPQEAIEAILKALNCTPSERAALLMEANRNPLTDEEGNTTPVSVLLGQIMSELHQDPETQRTIEDLRRNVQGGTLPAEKMNRITREIARVLENNI